MRELTIKRRFSTASLNRLDGIIKQRWAREPRLRYSMAISRVIREEIGDCKSVAFDEHALMRMSERNVTEDEVIAVLRNPEQTGLPAQPNRFRYRKSVGDRSVDVVIERDPTQIVVITVIA